MARGVEHIVFFHLENLDDAGEQKLISLAKELTEVIPGIKELKFGRNFSAARAQGFNFALRVFFEDKEALEKYSPHPKHQEFVAAISEYKKNLICLDFEDSLQ